MPHPFLLLHGTPLTPDIWSETAALLGASSCVAPDTTHVGASLNAQARIAAQVEQNLPEGDFDVVGHSFGGQIALELALLAPSRVRSLTILCSRDTPFPAFDSVAEALRSGAPVDPAASLSRWFTAPELASDLPVVEQVRCTVARALVPEWAAAVEAIAHYDSSARTQGLTDSMPVTLIAAEHDGVSTPAVMKDMSERIPGSTFIVVNDWAHMSPFAHPHQLADLITDSAVRAPV